MDTYKNEDFIRNDGPSHAVIYRSWAMPYHASSPWKLVKIMWHYVGNYVDEYNAFFTSVKWDLYIFFLFLFYYSLSSFLPITHSIQVGPRDWRKAPPHSATASERRPAPWTSWGTGWWSWPWTGTATPTCGSWTWPPRTCRPCRWRTRTWPCTTPQRPR